MINKINLAEKFGALLPQGPARAECLSWLFWQMGSAPYLGGGFGHFYAYAPAKIEYAIDRYAMEAKRQLDVLDRRLAESRYLAGDLYTIADIVKHAQYQAREMIRDIRLADGSALKVPGVVPKLSATPGGFDAGGPALGEHTDEILREIDYDPATIAALRARGIVG